MLYTVILGGYDVVPPLPRSLVSGVDCYLVTDDPDIEVPAGSAWIKRVVTDIKHPHKDQRRLKLLFHELFPDYETVIYVDGHIVLRHALQHILPLHRGGLTTVIHPVRSCVYTEGEACTKLNKAPEKLIQQQMEAYMAEGIPRNLGMYQTGFMIRSNTPEVRAFCEAWHLELTRFTHRDQLSIMPVVHRTGFRITGITYATFCRFATITKHIGRRSSQIYYITPFAVDGNIGLALNQDIQAVPGHDTWIVIRDGDTSFTTNNWGRHIDHVLQTHGDAYGVYGAVTNRIRSHHQRVPGMFDEWDMRKHWAKGAELEREKWGQVGAGGTGVAGFFMAFRKTTWARTPFRERDKTFDTTFCRAVRRHGDKIGIMTGLYIFHFYRPLSERPEDDIRHLAIVDGQGRR